MFNVKVGDHVLRCKPYTLRDFVKLNLAKSAGDAEMVKVAYSNILDEATGGKKFNKHESELVLVIIIANSEHYEKTMLEYSCECGYSFETEVDISRAAVDFNGPVEPKMYKFKNFSVSLKWPDLWADDDIAGMIVNSIDAVYVGNERIEINDLSETEMDDLFNAITEDDINYIKQILLAPKVSLGIPVKCGKCGKVHAHKISGFKEFVDLL